jgi:hypothetical protein
MTQILILKSSHAGSIPASLTKRAPATSQGPKAILIFKIMSNPFKNLKTELKQHLQGAINHLGPEFRKQSSDVDENANTVLCWESFGYEYAGWYHVSMYTQDAATKAWYCIGSAVIDAAEMALENTLPAS